VLSSAFVWLGIGADLLHAEEVSGVVLSAQTGEPVAGARVSAEPDGLMKYEGRIRPSQIAFTDSSGKFRFTGLEVGLVLIFARKNGFIPVDAGPFYEVPSSNVTIRLDPLSTIRGSVRDSGGKAKAGIDVRVIRSGIILSGEKKLSWAATVTTDDQGNFVIPDLIGSKYYIAAVQPMRPQGGSFAPVYFPDTTEFESAKEIDLHPGETFRADFRVALQPSFHLRGSVKNLASGSPAKLELYRGKVDVAVDHLTFNAQTGQFEIRDVVPGPYLLRATQGDRRAQMELQIADRDTENLALELSPGVDIPVLIQYPPEDVGKVYGPVWSLTLYPVDAEGPMFMGGLKYPAGSMVVQGVLPGRYRVVLGSSGRYFASAVSGGQDLLRNHELTVPARAPSPIEIVLKSDGASVSGKVSEGMASDVVVLVSQDSGQLFRAFLEQNGAFRFENIAPGDYRAYVWALAEDVEYANPDALIRLPNGVAVHVTKSGNTDLILRRVLTRP